MNILIVSLEFIGAKTTELLRAIIFFFRFLGDVFTSLLGNWKAISWRQTLLSTLHAGAVISVPFIVVSMLFGISMAVSIHVMLTRYNVQSEAMAISQATLLRDFTPIFIGFVLCVHSGLNLIEHDHPSLYATPQKVLYNTIIPLFFSMNITALLLYVYVATAFILSIIFTISFILQANTQDYLLGLGGINFYWQIINSIGCAIFNATIASFIAGYYYYDVSNRIMPIRQAVSKVITRGLFWLVVANVIIRIL